MLVPYFYMEIKAKQHFLFVYVKLRKCIQDLKEVECDKSCNWNFMYSSNYEAAFCLKSKQDTS